MDKKEYLIKILEQLEPVWDLASGLKILVTGENLADNVLDVVTHAVEGAIHTVKNEVSKRKLEKSLSALQKLKQMEAESRIQDEKDLAELDKMLEEI